MKSSTFATQTVIFEKRFKSLSVTIDVTGITHTRDGVVMLPAGTILGQDTVGNGTGTRVNLLENRSVKVRPCNDAFAFGILTHDVFFDLGVDKEATICYAGVAYIDNVEAELTNIKGSADTVHADARTNMPEITFKKI